MTGTATSARAADWVARVIAVLSILLVVAGALLPVIGGGGYLRHVIDTPEAVVGASFSAAGAVLATHPRARRLGWLLLAIGGFSSVYLACASWASHLVGGDFDAPLPDGAAGSTGLVAAWIATWAWLPAWVLVVTVLPLVLPEGRVLSRWWRVPVTIAFVVTTIGVLDLATAPGPLAHLTAVQNPLGSPVLAGLLRPVMPALDIAAPLLALVGLASIGLRSWRADAIGRRQLGWVGYAVTLAVLVILVGGPLDGPGWLVNLAVLLVPAGIAVAALRYRLFDLDLVVNRSVVAGALVAGAAIGYAAVVSWAGALLGTSRGVGSFVAAFAVALAFHPGRMVVQRYVDRLFFGRRGDPYALLRDLDRTLREAASPRQAVQAAAEVVRSGLRLAGAAVIVPMPSGGTVRAEAGSPSGATVSLPLDLHGQRVGELVAAPRRHEVRLTNVDLRVLAVLAGPLASAAYALRLSGDLEQSRGRLIEAREEERRRLRRDLHDGLGPQLAGVVMGLDSVRTAIARGDSYRADELSRTVGEQARDAIEDIRRLIAGLRPPVLDDLGLIGALRGTGPALAGTDVRITAEGDMSVLPAAVEVAAYRIASEALTNAVRHSGAATIDVLLRLTGKGLTVHVRDDGCGIAEDAVRGVGLNSMHERATELGGWCRVAGQEPRGTAVLALLPTGEP